MHIPKHTSHTTLLSFHRKWMTKSEYKILMKVKIIEYSKLSKKDLKLQIHLTFIYSEKATQFCEIFTLLLFYVVPVKSKVKISQNFVAFSEYMNINDLWSQDFHQLQMVGSIASLLIRSKKDVFFCFKLELNSKWR